MGQHVRFTPDIRVFSKISTSSRLGTRNQPMGYVYSRGSDPILDRASQPMKPLLDKVGWNSICSASPHGGWLVRHHDNRTYISVLYQVGLYRISDVMGLLTAGQRKAHCEQITLGVPQDVWCAAAPEILDAMTQWVGIGQKFQVPEGQFTASLFVPDHNFEIQYMPDTRAVDAKPNPYEHVDGSVRFSLTTYETSQGPQSLVNIVRDLDETQLKTLSLGAGWRLFNPELDIQLYDQARMFEPQGRDAASYATKRFEARKQENASPSLHPIALIQRACRALEIPSHDAQRLESIVPGLPTKLTSEDNISEQLLALDLAIDLTFTNLKLRDSVYEFARTWVIGALRSRTTCRIAGFAALGATEFMPSLFGEHLRIDGIHLNKSLYEFMDRVFASFTPAQLCAIVERLNEGLSSEVVDWSHHSAHFPANLPISLNPRPAFVVQAAE